MNKIVAIHQPQYLPWLPFVDKADRSDVLIYLDNVQFQRRGVQNRNTIKSVSGPLMLTVPILAHRDTLIKDVRIADGSWSRKHVAAIRNNYAHAPYLGLFNDGLRPILERSWTFLSDLNRTVTAWLFAQLDVKCECLLASDLDCDGKKEDLIVSLCEAVGAGVYFSGQGARDYQDELTFRRRGIELRYQNYEPEPYLQMHPQAGFIPGLSSLDLVLNTGPQAAAFLRAGRRPLS